MDTREAAVWLGAPGKPLTPQQVRFLLKTGQLTGTKIETPRGPVWDVDEASVKARIEARTKLNEEKEKYRMIEYPCCAGARARSKVGNGYGFCRTHQKSFWFGKSDENFREKTLISDEKQEISDAHQTH